MHVRTKPLKLRMRVRTKLCGFERFGERNLAFLRDCRAECARLERFGERKLTVLRACGLPERMLEGAPVLLKPL